MLNSTETLAQKFVRKGFWLYFFTVIMGPMGYMIKMIISNDLQVDEVGMIYGVISFIGLLAVFNDFGCTESLNYFLPKYLIKQEYGKAKYLLWLAFRIQLISSLIVSCILFFGSEWLARIYFENPTVTTLLHISCIYFIGNNILHIATVFFSVSQDTKLQKFSEFCRMTATLIGVSILFFTDSGNIIHYMWTWAIGISIGTIIAGYLAYTRYYITYFRGVDFEMIPEERSHFFRYALATLLTANIGMIFSQVDMQLIITMLGNEATGYYSNYLSLLNIPFIFIGPIMGFLFPVISELHSRGNTDSMRELFSKFSLYFSIIGVWISTIMLQMGIAMAIVFFGAKFLFSGEILIYSAVFLTLNLLIQINFQFLAGTGKIGSRARILAIVLPINIIINIIGIHYLGVKGSALAVGLTWIPLWYLSYREIGLYRNQFQWKPLLSNILYASIGMFLGFWIHGLGVFDLETRMGNLYYILLALTLNISIFCVGNWHLLREVVDTIRKNK